MEKSKLQSFINRYYLAGNCEAVTVKSNGQSINCELIDVDQTVVGKVKWKTDPFMSGELGINHTGALTKMLSAVGDKIDIEVNDAQGKNYAMKIKEGSTTMTFMLADTSVIPAVPTINAEPEYEVTIDIDELFVNKFIKAKNALPDANNFAVQVQNGKITFIINYTTINSDNVTFEIDGTANELEPICFSADKLKEVLTANKGDKGTMHISSNGLARVDFTGTDFDSNYWLVQLQN
jgi:hypothetical protein